MNFSSNPSLRSGPRAWEKDTETRQIFTYAISSIILFRIGTRCKCDDGAWHGTYGSF